jgi:hypothetical protein
MGQTFMPFGIGDSLKSAKNIQVTNSQKSDKILRILLEDV